MPRWVHQADELLEKMAGIMGSRGCFRVKLDGEQRHFTMPETGHGVIVEVDVGHLTTGSLQTGLIHAKTVILAGDLDAFPNQVRDRLIGPSVPERKFPGLGSQ